MDHLLLGDVDRVGALRWGAFIARISRGRTIREFIVGVLIRPRASLFHDLVQRVRRGGHPARQRDERRFPQLKPSTTTARPSRCSSSSTPTRAHCSPRSWPCS